ncbi:MAG TPA: ribosome-associated translation inhibitor RaiA [Patescibacteria group bacterium]|nr:ribosome-associated translation inhibitor RaiA [Patescibacteria group bacterium]
MKLEGISGNNIEVTPSIKEYTQTRIEKLSKIVMNMEPATVRVEVGKPSEQYRKGEDVFYAEFTATVQDQNFSAKRTDPSVFKAIDKVRVDMYRQIITWKKKGRSAKRKDEVITKQMLRAGNHKE